MLRQLRDLDRLGDDQGATAIEYALVASLIALALVVALTAIGVNLSVIFNKIAPSLAT